MSDRYNCQGQYTKLPPQVTFTVQSLGAIIVSIFLFFPLRSSPNTHPLGRTAQLHHYENHH